MKYKFLDQINYPSDLKKFNKDNLKTISAELRDKTINVVSKTGGHLGAGLGVVELTIALHYIFDTPKDKLIWDVGHQAYPHKILTGRKLKLFVRKEAYTALSNVLKVNMILLEQLIVQHLYLQGWVLKLHKKLRKIIPV